MTALLLAAAITVNAPSDDSQRRSFLWLLPGLGLSGIADGMLIAGGAFTAQGRNAQAACLPHCVDQGAIPLGIGVIMLMAGLVAKILAAPLVILGIRERVLYGFDLSVEKSDASASLPIAPPSRACVRCQVSCS